MKGKEKCKILKEIRAEIARANEIEWVTENCTHKGDCRGSCPKCESEVAALERALERRRAMGKTVAVVGLSAGIIATSTACEGLEEYRGETADRSDSSFVTTTVFDETTYSPTGDIDIGGVPMPPESEDEYPVTDDQRPNVTTEEDLLEGEPADPVYYLSDFDLPTWGATVITITDVWAYPVLGEDEPVGDRIPVCIHAGENYINWGTYTDQGVKIITYQGQYWAIIQ